MSTPKFKTLLFLACVVQVILEKVPDAARYSAMPCFRSVLCVD